jgi:hypothetical protein
VDDVLRCSPILHRFPQLGEQALTHHSQGPEPSPSLSTILLTKYGQPQLSRIERFIVVPPFGNNTTLAAHLTPRPRRLTPCDARQFLTNEYLSCRTIHQFIPSIHLEQTIPQPLRAGYSTHHQRSTASSHSRWPHQAALTSLPAAGSTTPQIVTLKAEEALLKSYGDEG